MKINSIDTIYKDFKFRSRLEARWAVFFDALGLLWEYEKEGYEIDGLRYLPDFWLPELECWIEIKGDTPGYVERIKAVKLCLRSRKDVHIFVGAPYQSESFRFGSVRAGHRRRFHPRTGSRTVRHPEKASRFAVVPFLALGPTCQ